MVNAEALNFLVNNWWLVAAIAIWSIPWKGWALWRAAKRNHWWWFVIILVLNTIGILEIIYIFFVTGKKKDELQSQN